MYIIYDALSGTHFGPYESYDDAQIALLQIDEEALGSTTEELSIHEVVEPQQWYMDNALEFAVRAEY